MNSDNKIIEKAMDLFMRYGLKSITMDEVARSLGISKKTLYQVVDNKADLIGKAMQVHIEGEKCALGEIHENSENAIDEMLKVGRYISRLLQQMNPSIIYDLKKYYPDGWEMMESLHFEHTHKMIKANIERGMSEDLYRKDLNSDIISRLYVGRMDLVVDKNLFPFGEYTFLQIHENFINYHLYALMSKKGVAVFESITNEK
jgi:AcrR family transcriptional regulator